MPSLLETCTSVCSSRASASNSPFPVHLLTSSDFYRETASCYIGTMSTFKHPLQWTRFLFCLSLQDRLWWSGKKEPCSFLLSSSQPVNIFVKVCRQHNHMEYSGSTFINAKPAIALLYFHSICSPLKFSWASLVTSGTTPPWELSSSSQSLRLPPRTWAKRLSPRLPGHTGQAGAACWWVSPISGCGSQVFWGSSASPMMILLLPNNSSAFVWLFINFSFSETSSAIILFNADNN